MIRRHRPKQLIEVGSGFSSAAMLDVNDRFFTGDIRFTFIEPYPKRLLGLLTAQDKAKCKILQKGVQDVPISTFEALEKDDILFIDSSHVGKIGSDVLYILNSVLPALKAGVVIHFHDVMWPFEYPKVWFDIGRAWNEAYLLRAFLQYNGAFEILFFNSFLETHHRGTLEKQLPLMLKAPSSWITPGNTSLWIRKTV